MNARSVYSLRKFNKAAHTAKFPQHGILCLIFTYAITKRSRFQWSCGLKSGSVAPRLLVWRFRIPPEA
jgi:hypothetical protein